MFILISVQRIDCRLFLCLSPCAQPDPHVFVIASRRERAPEGDGARPRRDANPLSAGRRAPGRRARAAFEGALRFHRARRDRPTPRALLRAQEAARRLLPQHCAPHSNEPAVSRFFPLSLSLRVANFDNSKVARRTGHSVVRRGGVHRVNGGVRRRRHRQTRGAHELLQREILQTCVPLLRTLLFSQTVVKYEQTMKALCIDLSASRSTAQCRTTSTTRT